MAYALMLGATKESYEQELKSRRSIFLNGVHHARELTTISQIMFTMLGLLHGYEHGNREYIDLMTNAAIIIVPMVNVDGVFYIDKAWIMTSKFEYIRKNRHVYDKQRGCQPEDQGVDLNRNYDYQFGDNDDGSSGMACAEDFRGPFAFSEPETKAVRDFLLEHRGVKIALNFHAWGPLFI